MTNSEQPQRVRAWRFQRLAPDWRVLSMSGTGAWFDTPSFAAGATLVRRVAELADTGPAIGSGTPSLDLRASGVQVWIPYGEGLTTAKLALAQGISAAARELGLTADPSVPQDLEWGIDTLDKPTLLPFWQTLLGYEDTEFDDLVDPLRRDPRVWFYEAAPRPLRNRIHFDVAVPREVAQERVAAIGAPADYDPDNGSRCCRTRRATRSTTSRPTGWATIPAVRTGGCRSAAWSSIRSPSCEWRRSWPAGWPRRATSSGCRC